MARRKACRLKGASQDAPNQFDFLQQRFEDAKKAPRRVSSYMDTTQCHIDRMIKLWEEYCHSRRPPLDSHAEMRDCDPARMQNFLLWMLEKYEIKKTSSVSTYWRQLSQVYITWTGTRMEPKVLKDIFVFIEIDLTREYQLNDLEEVKPTLDAQDFLELLQYHWLSDTNVFAAELQRVQLASILLAAAFTGSRPSALLAIEYRDLDLFLLRDPTSGLPTMVLRVTLTKTKGQAKRKRPKSYTFNLDDNPAFCIVSHFIALAFHDGAFAARGLTSPDLLFGLNLTNNKCTPIPWKEEKLSTPIFRPIEESGDEAYVSASESLSYQTYHAWVKRLGEDLGFPEVLTTYCLRRATGNAINDDSRSNDAIRNLVMDHSNSEIFERSYLSRQIRYDTQAAYLGRDPNQLLIQAANRMSRLQDPHRPRKLDDRQREQVRRSKIIQDLYAARQSLSQEIYDSFDTLKEAKAESSPLHVEYLRIQRLLVATIRAEERSLLKATRQKYDRQAPIDNIERQLSGAIVRTDTPLTIHERPQLAFLERSRIGEALFSEKPSMLLLERGSNWRVPFINDLIALCGRRERCTPSKRRERRNTKSESDEPKEKKPATFELYPVRCRPYQCLFCLGSVDLADGDRRHDFATRYSLRRHLQRCHAKRLQRSNGIYCPHPHANCVGLVFKDPGHFKNHAARVHFVEM